MAGGGGRARSTLSIRGLHINNANNLLTLQLWFPDIQLIGLAVRRKLNFFINSKQCGLFVLMYVNAGVGRGTRREVTYCRPGGKRQGLGMEARSDLSVGQHTWLLNLTVNILCTD